MTDPIRILFLADTHLGFDLPIRPRVERRRRGHDFLANYAAALAPALAGEVDLVIHGGDVFDRPGVIGTLAWQAFEPLLRIAEGGTPVVIVPGNHERSRLPHLRFAAHRNVHVFDRPRTFGVTVRGRRVALTGFPYQRRNVRTEFGALLAASGWEAEPADYRLLCFHHCVEGATVGPADFVFRSAPDVIRPEAIPAAFAAALTGHIHRHQVLTHGLRGAALPVPVLYPGSIERTALAEIGEPKGYLILDLGSGAAAVQWSFRHLYARPMFREQLNATGRSADALAGAVAALVRSVPEDAVLSIRLDGEVTAEQRAGLRADRLREIVPAAMNLELRYGDLRFERRRRHRAPAPPPEQLTLE
ncbi:MAG: exonuclease SbcCD subunit D [Gemmatimonadales bacterium]